MPDRLDEQRPHRRRGISLRLRLTLWMTAIACVIQLSLGLLLQLYQGQAIQDFFDSRMADRVRSAAASLSRFVPLVSAEQLATALRDEYISVGVTDASFNLLSEDGRLIMSTRAQGITVPREQLENALTDPVFPRVSLVPPGLSEFSPRPRAVVAPILGPDNSKYYLLMVYVDENARRMLRLLQRVVLFSVPIGLVAAAVSAWVISGIAVRPFESLRVAARRLRPDTISSSVEMPTSGAEVASVREELESARRQIEQAFAAQERFMSNVSHELKTPIAVIITQSQTLNTQGLPRPITDFIKSQREELERLGNMVDSFLLLTRVRGGMKEVPVASVCYIRDVLVESYASCLPLARQHRVRIDLRFPDSEDADARVTGNPELLRVVFDNIVRNAIRFSPANAEVRVQLSTLDDRFIRVAIRDFGAGIPAELLPRIFARFSQATDEQRRGRGHGLGLEIALGIAELHNGSITVSNCADVGCEFVVMLPKYPHTAPPPAQPAAPS